MRGSGVSQHPGGGNAVNGFWKACSTHRPLGLREKRHQESISKLSPSVHWTAQPHLQNNTGAVFLSIHLLHTSKSARSGPRSDSASPRIGTGPMVWGTAVPLLVLEGQALDFQRGPSAVGEARDDTVSSCALYLPGDRTKSSETGPTLWLQALYQRYISCPCLPGPHQPHTDLTLIGRGGGRAMGSPGLSRPAKAEWATAAGPAGPCPSC